MVVKHSHSTLLKFGMTSNFEITFNLTDISNYVQIKSSQLLNKNVKQNVCWTEHHFKIDFKIGAA